MLRGISGCQRVSERLRTPIESLRSFMNTSSLAFASAPRPSADIKGGALRFPFHPISGAGRNCAAHAGEMGANPGREPPFFFPNPADAVVPNGGGVPYPPRTANLHHE